MQKQTKNFTLKAKLITALLAISLIPLLVIGTVSIHKSNKILKSKLETTSTQTVHEITRGLDNYFTAMSNIIRILANDTNIEEANNPTYFEFAKDLIANVKATDPAIINIYVGTESGMFYTDPHADLPADFDHRKRDWYIQAVNAPNQVIITDPYVDVATGQMVVSLTKAVQGKGSLIGVVGIDLDLSILSASLSDIKMGDSGYIYITDKNGSLIAHPDYSLIGTDTVAQLSHWEKIKANANGFVTYEYNNETKFASHETSDLTGWKIVASMNESELSRDTSEIKTSILLIAVIALLSSITVAILFSMPISRNIRSLLSALDRLSQGDLTASVAISSRDEFNLLSKHFNEMAENISTLIRNVSNASTTVLDSSVTLANMAEETNASLTEVARAVEDVAKGASEQAQNASDGAASVSDLADRLTEIDSSTDAMDELSKNARELTLRGLEGVELLMQNSDNTMESTVKVSDMVYAVSESMKQISAISDTIDAITAQTTLLSLNASIEASRAGESGRGFAVVASEIRNLAEQSKASTVKIKDIIGDISNKTELSVQAMDVTRQNVKEQVSLVNQTQNLFNEIMEAVRVLSEKTSEIKQHVDDISEHKNNIVFQIENISAISEESASATEEVTASAEQIATTMDEITQHALDLQSLSEDLQKKINNFKF
jgi:methyl-accepting chemotaxis protein